MAKKDEPKPERDIQPVVPSDLGLTLTGAIGHTPTPAQQSGPTRPIEETLRIGVSLEKVIFSQKNPEIIWLFTDATEEQILAAGLNPDDIDQWGLNIADDCLPTSPEFNTIDGFIAYLKAKALPGYESQIR